MTFHEPSCGSCQHFAASCCPDEQGTVVGKCTGFPRGSNPFKGVYGLELLGMLDVLTHSKCKSTDWCGKFTAMVTNDISRTNARIT
jgi:hypothetical protein